MLEQRLGGGFQSGAYLVRDQAETPAALKWSTDLDWAGVVQQAHRCWLRLTHGWPTPVWLAVGCI